jgi:tetratricopeptide (TPR) repeat protein
MKTFVNDKNHLINYCENYFRQNEEFLLIIDEFKKEYSSLKSLWWFARNPFLSRLLIKALRLKNFFILFLSRFFLQDIYRQLQQNKSSKPIRVYRSQLFTKDYFQILENSIGKLISINSFLLTNLVRKQALSFLKESIITDDIQRILFEIDADPKLIGIKSFANITSLSYFVGEQQILFMPGSIFRIVNIRHEDKNLSIIQMILCTNTEQEFRLMHDLEQCDLLSFGQMLVDMKKFNQAEIYFGHLLHDLPYKHSDIPICYDTLGQILLEKGQFSSSLKWYKKSLEIKIRTFGTNDPTIAALHNNMASVHLKNNDYTAALESFQIALTIFQQKCKESDPHIAECLNNIAMVYRNENKYEEALDDKL